MTDGASLAGNAAAAYGADNVELTSGVGYFKWLADNNLQGVQAEVIVNISVVDGNFAGARVESYSGNGVFSLPVP